ncbi:hypothetical protein NDU88_002828 [Pleurodeles waltl]|uniref:Uncharacterized protein n=1 Tax=Pleurodeles waltl TaxID=8319 RepID=A0AAV7UB01_PLEWA|nr:hypothetical protein NDU88_002828 [Pleurodeles waltl]
MPGAVHHRVHDLNSAKAKSFRASLLTRGLRADLARTSSIEIGFTDFSGDGDSSKVFLLLKLVIEIS